MTVSARTASQISASTLAVSLADPKLREHQLNIIAEFAAGKVDPVEAGKKGGQSSGVSGGDSGSSGSTGKGQFAGGKVDPVEAGKKGGSS